MIIRRLIVPTVAAVFTLHAVQANAQSAFPAPLPNQTSSPTPSSTSAFPAPLPGQSGSAPAQSSPFPPVSGGAFPAAGAAPIAGGAGGFAAPPPAAPMGQQAGGEECMNDFVKLRQDAEKRGAAIQAAGKRKAPAAEACKLIGAFAAAETKMIKYVVVNSKKCGIPGEIAEQLKKGHQNTEGMQKKVCDIAAQQQQRGPAGPSLADVLGSSSATPEANASAKKFGGTTFDTLNGNVLQR
ncbi:hypothetical protein [Rhodopseudomonas pseudopalustris]|uniref:Uncharacterized protein n=1 Tax=Rhodopseudomonas pseudopalustris TaxID=1513892 RepID=A0A1H8LEC3_9BRAD|nr:hypothetical protein [Rhodopseudomonas pseudopalustris]MBB1092661.1 hypothetical protein [Rhodopseudomonas palustris]SEO03118.1 hypothetical protein SAMN05444123_10126 [Rhodopseudomonas pseudopalustris]